MNLFGLEVQLPYGGYELLCVPLLDGKRKGVMHVKDTVIENVLQKEKMDLKGVTGKHDLRYLHSS